MISLIKGITVTLTERTRTGIDELNNPIYSESTVDVENVLVEPISTNDLISDVNLNGKIEECRLCIPKGDTHEWENTTVQFFGHTYKTYGYEEEWIEENVPLDWNKKVRVKRIG